MRLYTEKQVADFKRLFGEDLDAWCHPFWGVFDLERFDQEFVRPAGGTGGEFVVERWGREAGELLVDLIAINTRGGEA